MSGVERKRGQKRNKKKKRSSSFHRVHSVHTVHNVFYTVRMSIPTLLLSVSKIRQVAAATAASTRRDSRKNSSFYSCEPYLPSGRPRGKLISTETSYKITTSTSCVRRKENIIIYVRTPSCAYYYYYFHHYYYYVLFVCYFKCFFFSFSRRVGVRPYVISTIFTF